MKKYSYVLGFLLALVLLVFCWWFFSSRTPVPVATATHSVPPPPVTSTQTSLSTNSSSASTATNAAPAASDSIPDYAKERVKKVLAVLATENSQPLDMHGKVIDQYDQPVVAAKVKGSILLNEGVERSKDDIHYTETDAQGLFSFTGVHGVTLGIWPQKEGYYYDLKLTSQRKGNYHGSPENPDVFVMWKLKGAEPMIHSKIHTYIPCDGTTVSFDLRTGRKTVNGGDFAVTLIRNPVNIDRSKPYDWTMTLAMAGGGLVEIADSYPNEAPAEGYQSSITIAMSVDAEGWSNSANHSYYFKSGQGFGRITINATTDFQPPPTFFGADIYFNPAPGSRNLEYDPAKQIKVK